MARATLVLDMAVGEVGVLTTDNDNGAEMEAFQRRISGCDDLSGEDLNEAFCDALTLEMGRMLEVVTKETVPVDLVLPDTDITMEGLAAFAVSVILHNLHDRLPSEWRA